jgi:hypothetical protein
MAHPQLCKQSNTDITCSQQDDRLVSCSSLVLLPILTSCRTAVVFAVQSWLSETAEQRRTASTPAYFQVGMSRTYRASVWKMPANSISVMSLLVVSIESSQCNTKSLIRCYRATLLCCYRLLQVAWAQEPEPRQVFHVRSASETNTDFVPSQLQAPPAAPPS